VKPAVLQLIDSFNQGGSERQALQLTRLLVESGRFKVHLACLSPEGVLRDSINDLDLGEIPSFPLNSFTDRNAVRQLRRFVRWLKASRIDILHTHDFYTNIFGMAGGGLARLPVRVASMRETAGMRSAAQKQVQRIAYSLAHHVVANSNAVREKLISELSTGMRYSEESHAIQAAVAGQGVALLSLVLVEEELRLGLLRTVGGRTLKGMSYHVLKSRQRPVSDAVLIVEAWLVRRSAAAADVCHGPAAVGTAALSP